MPPKRRTRTQTLKENLSRARERQKQVKAQTKLYSGGSGLQELIRTRPKHQQVVYQQYLKRQQFLKKQQITQMQQRRWAPHGPASMLASIEVGPHQVEVTRSTIESYETYVFDVRCLLCQNRATVELPWATVEQAMSDGDTATLADLILDGVRKAVIYWTCNDAAIQWACAAEGLTLLLASHPKGLHWRKIQSWGLKIGLHGAELLPLGMTLGFTSLNSRWSTHVNETWRLPDSHPLHRSE